MYLWERYIQRFRFTFLQFSIGGFTNPWTCCPVLIEVYIYFNVPLNRHRTTASRFLRVCCAQATLSLLFCFSMRPRGRAKACGLFVAGSALKKEIIINTRQRLLRFLFSSSNPSPGVSPFHYCLERARVSREMD